MQRHCTNRFVMDRRAAKSELVPLEHLWLLTTFAHGPGCQADEGRAGADW